MLKFRKMLSIVVVALILGTGGGWATDARAAGHSLTVAFATPIAYRPGNSGTAGGSNNPTAGAFYIYALDVQIGSGQAVVRYTTDTGDSFWFAFPYNPNTQAVVAALQAALNTDFPSNQPTITYQ